MSLENYIKRYTSGHASAKRMQEMYDNPDNYTYEQFEEQLDKAKYRPSKKDDNVGGNTMEYQKLLDRYDGNEDRANQEFDGTMGAYRANKAQAMSDFLAKKMASLKNNMPKEGPKEEAKSEPEPEKKEKKPITYSPEMQQALSRVRNYESQYVNQAMNNEYNFGFNGFKKNKQNGPQETTMPVPPRNEENGLPPSTNGFVPPRYGETRTPKPAPPRKGETDLLPQTSFRPRRESNNQLDFSNV